MTTHAIKVQTVPRVRSAAAFSSRGFRFFFAGQMTSQVGTWFQILAISLILVDATGSAIALALVSVATFGPTLLLGSLPARACTRFSSRSILITTVLANALCAGGLALLLLQHEIVLWAVYLLLTVSGAFSVFGRVAAQTFIYELVGPSLLQNAAVWSAQYVSAARVIGPSIAGFMYYLAGPAACLALNALCFTLSAAVFCCIRRRELFVRERPAENVSGKAIRAALPGRVRLLISANFVVAFCSFNLAVLVTAIVTMDFGGDGAALGFAHTLNAAGSLIGGFAITRIRTITPAMVGIALLGFGASQFLAAESPSIGFFLGASVVLGATMGVYQSVITANIQTGTPQPLVGRAMALLNMGTFGMVPLGSLSMGLLIDAASGRFALLLASVASLLVGLTVVGVLAWVARARRLALPASV